MSQFFGDDTPPSPAAMDLPGGADYDALADLFLDDGPALRLTEADADELSASEPSSGAGRGIPSGSSLDVDPGPRAASRPDVSPRGLTIEALVLGHLPVLAGAWAAQHARSLARERGAPAALARLTADAAVVQAVGPREALESFGERDSLEDAARLASARCGDVVVRVDATSELDLAAAPRVDRVTLLAGTDEAAVVAAYRTLKGLKDAMGEGARPVAVRLMGGGEDATAAAEARLRRVAQAFLEMEIEFLPAAGRIDAGTGATLYRGPGSAEGEDGFETFLSMLNPPELEPEEFAAPEVEPEDGPAGEPLALRLGLRPLGAVCPAAPEVELAVDGAGGLHLLGVGAGSAGALLAAEGWAEGNRALLGAAAGLDDGFEIVARVLTDEPARDRRLLDGRFRVDLLREVRVGAESAWCCVPLNRTD